MDGIYKSYCIHGQPIHYSNFCSGCRAMKEAQRDKLTEEYYKEKHKHFNFKKYFNEQYNYYFTNPSIEVEQKIKIRENDKFASLKRSNSEDELKKSYYKLCRKLHPDKGGSTKLMAKLNQLYDILRSQFI